MSEVGNTNDLSVSQPVASELEKASHLTASERNSPEKIPSASSTLVSRVLTVLIAVIWIVAPAKLLLERNQLFDIWARRIKSDASMSSIFIEQSIAGADLVLRDLVSHLELRRDILPTDVFNRYVTSRELHERLLSAKSALPNLNVLSVVSPTGEVLNFSRSYPAVSEAGERINISDREYFRTLTLNPGNSVISGTLRNRGDGRRVFFLARKIQATDGRLLGIALAGIDYDGLSSFLDEVSASVLEMGGGKAVSIYSNECRIISVPEVIETEPCASEESTLRRLERLAIAKIKVEHGQIRFDGLLEKNPAVVAVQSLSNYPITVVASSSDPVILADWKRNAIQTLFVAIVLTLCFTIILRLVARTSLKDAETINSLVAARKQALDALIDKERFITTMSHEIRTPLNGVIGAISLLKRSELRADQVVPVQAATSSAEFLLTTLNEILDYSRINAGHFNSATIDFNLKAMVEDVIEIGRQAATEGAMTLSYVVDEKLPEVVHGDRHLIMRILMNLVGNSIRFTDKGYVRVFVRGARAEHLNWNLQFTVEDSGMGIKKSDLERIFDPFEQVTSDYSKPGAGSGLGLSICKAISNFLGGHIKVESVFGVGSRFTFSLDIAEVSVPNPASEGSPSDTKNEAATNVPLRILIVEDTPANQVVMRLILEKLGHKVEIASDGAQAVRMFCAAEYDVIYMDVQLPVMDGYASTRMIRAVESERRLKIPPTGGTPTPIFGLSAFSSSSAREKAESSGMTGYIAKPVTMEILERSLARIQPISREAVGHRVAAGKLSDALDSREIVELWQTLGSEGFVIAIGHFKADVRATIERMRSGMEKRDWPESARAAHRLKGLMIQFGGLELARIFTQIEASASSTEDTDLNDATFEGYSIEEILDESIEVMESVAKFSLQLGADMHKELSA